MQPARPGHAPAGLLPWSLCHAVSSRGVLSSSTAVPGGGVSLRDCLQRPSKLLRSDPWRAQPGSAKGRMAFTSRRAHSFPLAAYPENEQRAEVQSRRDGAGRCTRSLQRIEQLGTHAHPASTRCCARHPRPQPLATQATLRQRLERQIADPTRSQWCREHVMIADGRALCTASDSNAA